MNFIHYRIGPHLVKLRCPSLSFFLVREMSILPTLSIFRTTETTPRERALFTVWIVDKGSNSTHPPMREVGQFEWDEAEVIIYRPGSSLRQYEFVFTLRSDGSKYRMHLDLTLRRITVELSSVSLPTPSDCFMLNNCLMMSYSFFAARQRTLLMHASVVMVKGKGYLFLGKSGTGKSTHSALWLKHVRKAELLNDDNPVVHFDPLTGQATVYGSPWSGKTPCYRRESVPVGAIVRLTQAPQNLMQRCGYAQAFAALLPSCSSLQQDAKGYRALLDTVKGLAEHVPVYALGCLPDKAAAQLCYKTVTKA